MDEIITFFMAYRTLFKPLAIGSMEVKNRLVMPPMVRNYASKSGLVTNQYIDHISTIAKGGVGMMILEASYISPEGRGFTKELAIDRDTAIPGLKKLAKAAHKHKAKIGIQLYHAGRQTTSAKSGYQPVAPSPIPDPLMQEAPKQLSVTAIKKLVKQYAEAAVRAKKAGLDFVEIHGAHGYLITQFLSPFTNKRKDKYGGSFENRLRFAKEVVIAVREAVGPKYPVTIRLSADELVPDGLTLKDTKKIVQELEKIGIDAFHISVGNYASYTQGMLIQPMAINDGALIKYAQGVKEVANVPVIAVGKIRDPKTATQVIRKGYADFVAIGRTLLADPEYPNKIQAGKLKDVNPCIACNQGCISRLFADQDVRCTTNPVCSRETDFKKTGGKKKIVVIGGGPAGLSAARIAAENGSEVILFEKTKYLGGQLHLASAAPHRQGWKELYLQLVYDMKRLGVTIKLNHEPTPEEVKELKPHRIIVATGSTAHNPDIPGLKDVYHLNAREVLGREGRLKGEVVVVGGGCAGAQTAEYIAARRHKVTIVEMTENIALDAPLADRMLLLGRLEKKGVELMTNTRVVSFKPGEVEIQKGNKKSKIKAKTVVVCLGSVPEKKIARKMKKVCKDVVIVGDAKRPRRVTEAMAEGALAALGKPLKI